MNLENVKTPADLINQNKEQTPFQIAVNALGEANYNDTRLITLWLIKNMLDFHMERAAACVDDPAEGNAVGWAHDAGKLEMILAALKEVD